jgi:hypothetical protein
MNEMQTWDGAGDRAQEAAVNAAHGLLLSSQRWASQVKNGGSQFRGWRIAPVYEENNKHLLTRLDSEVVRRLNKLVDRRFKSPALLLYVATWQEAMAIPADELSNEAETAVVLVMMRMQSTALLVDAYKQAPMSSALMREMSDRGLLRSR